MRICGIEPLTKAALVILALIVSGLSAHAQLDLAQAVDATNLVWTSGGNAQWIVQTNVTQDGRNAAQSGIISDSQESWLEATVTGPGVVAFWWKVSSAAAFDFVEFRIGGILQTGRISGEVGWQPRFYPVAEGTQSLLWRYVKDPRFALGQDRGWVDEVVFVTNSGPPVIVVQPKSQTVVAGLDITLGVGAGGDPGFTYQWLFNHTNAIGGATNASLTLTNLQTIDSGIYSVAVSNLYGFTFSQETVLTVAHSGLVDDILLFFEGRAPRPYEAALRNMGRDYRRFNDITSFNDSVRKADPGTSLAVIDSLHSWTDFSGAVDFVNTGGRAILQYWNVGASTSLASVFNVAIVLTNSNPLPIYDWGGSSFFAGLSNPFYLIQTISSPNGQTFQPIAGGQAVSGYVSSKRANQAALVIGNSGRTIINGFFLQNAYLIDDAATFAQNEIQYLINLTSSAVPTKPTIHGQPSDQFGVLGDGVNLFATATGSAPFTFQWLQNGTSLMNETNSILSFDHFQSGTAGNYTVIISNSFGSVTSAPLALAVAPSSLPAVKTVFIIVMENYDWSEIFGSPNCPYINHVLLPMASFATQYYNPPGLHPSEPNYLWLESGTNFGIWYDLTYSPQIRSTNHLVTQLEHAGISWKTYQESISGVLCPLSDKYPYAVRHNPYAAFIDVIGNPAYCTNHVRPYTELASDLQNNTVARYNFITPNVTNDMHDLPPGYTSASAAGDHWLSLEVPRILASAAYQNNGALFITWDEGGFDDGPIGMILLSPFAKGSGYSNSIYYTHSSTLRTMQLIFGLRPFLGDAVNATSLDDLFGKVFITSGQMAADGQFQFTITGLIPGRTNIVEFSTDLASWTAISTNLSTGTTVTFTDTLSTKSNQLFYRVVQLP